MPASASGLEEMAFSPYWDKKDDPALQARHDMMRARSRPYGAQDTVYRAIPLSNTGCRARYARADHDLSARDLPPRLPRSTADPGAARQPRIFMKRGQALLERRQPVEAIAPLRKAGSFRITPRSSEMLLGQALRGAAIRPYREAISILARRWDAKPKRRSAIPTPMAYGGKGVLADADLALPGRLSSAATTRPARSCLARQDTFCRSHPRLGQGRRYRHAKPMPARRKNTRNK